MRYSALHQKWYYAKQLIREFVRQHKKILLLGFCLFLLGTIAGVISAVRYASIVEVRHLSDAPLLAFLAGESSIFTLFFARIISYSFIGLIIVFISSTIFLMPISFLIIVYKSFITALTFSFFVILFGLSGLLLGIFVILPVSILLYGALIILVSACARRCLECRRYGTPYFGVTSGFLMQLVYSVFVLFLLAALIELIFLPIVSVFFIVII